MLIIDYYKIKQNILSYSKNNSLIIVLKNNAYGFGLERILKILSMAYVDTVAVNDFTEAVEVRRINNSIKILLFGKYNSTYDYIKYDITPTAICFEDIIELEKNHIPYYAKIDSSMHRFGFCSVSDILPPGNYLKGIYVHFPKLTNDAIDTANRLGVISRIYNLDFHCGGSILLGNTGEAIRIGGALYKNCRKLYAHIIEIKEIKKGEPIGYESSYVADEDHLYAILDIGYFNGIGRYFDGYVSIKDRLYKSIGLVCMNHTFIKVDENVKINDLVEFFGTKVPIDDFLKHNNMTFYESFFCLK